jgi:hypothetical protein
MAKADWTDEKFPQNVIPLSNSPTEARDTTDKAAARQKKTSTTGIKARNERKRGKSTAAVKDESDDLLRQAKRHSRTVMTRKTWIRRHLHQQRRARSTATMVSTRLDIEKE